MFRFGSAPELKLAAVELVVGLLGFGTYRLLSEMGELSVNVWIRAARKFSLFLRLLISLVCELQLSREVSFLVFGHS